jgi:uncharacterized protein (DUF1501 family)
MACTFSEFGRCAKENGTNGTDHGTLAPMMVFGKAVRPKVHGTNVNLNDLTTDNQVKNLQFDYRQIFATLLQDWLGANPHVMEEGLIANYQKMFLVTPPAIMVAALRFRISSSPQPPSRLPLIRHL